MLSSLFLQQFRNYTESEFLFDHSLTIITGENGKGKTNIVEAISALAFIKPFRSSNREVFVQHGKGFARVVGQCADEVLDIFWGIETGKALQVRHNDVILNSKEYMKEKGFHAVLFSPEDLNLPILSPSIRRSFLARLLSSLFPDYFTSALQYKHILSQRNALLKKYATGSVQKDEFTFWNQQLVKEYEILQSFHSGFFAFANTYITQEYKKISGKDEEVSIDPLYSFPLEKDFADVLAGAFEQDVWRGSTGKGVQRDDFSLLLRGVPVEEAASRGEMRSVILALKKVEQRYLELYTGKKPLLLLDDVFSELDHDHQSHLLESLQGQQCIITTTEVEIDLPDGLDYGYIALGE